MLILVEYNSLVKGWLVHFWMETRHHMFLVKRHMCAELLERNMMTERTSPQVL